MALHHGKAKNIWLSRNLDPPGEACMYVRMHLATKKTERQLQLNIDQIV
jgi:hypothetical protein